MDKFEVTMKNNIEGTNKWEVWTKAVEGGGKIEATTEENLNYLY